MPLALLDFTSGNVDLAVTISGTNVSSLKCVLGALSFLTRRDMADQKTLCSGPWQQRSPQNKGCYITALKWASKGAAYSDPLVMFGTTAPLVVTFTADTGNTITGLFHAVEEGLGGNAGAAAFGGPFGMESYGAISSTWVTS